MTIINPASAISLVTEQRKRRNAKSWLVFVLVSSLVAVWIFPYYIVFSFADKSTVAQQTTNLLSPPHSINLGRFIYAWQYADLTPKFLNSLYIAAIGTLLSIVIAFFAAFAFGIGRSRHRTVILTMCMVAYAIPQEAIVFPSFKFFNWANLYGNQLTVSLVLGILYSAFATYLLTTVMADFPREILESAYVDGARSWRMLRSIIFPIIRPTIAALSAMIFIWDWNEYMIPLILLPDDRTQTLPITIASAMGGGGGFGSGENYSVMAMACVLGAIPSIFFFILFQRTITKGISLGSSN